MSTMTIQAIPDKCFGAVVENVSLPSISESEFNALHEAFLHYGFLVFPKQFLSEQQNIDFGRRFGELEFGALPIANVRKISEGEYGEVFELNAQQMRTNLGNEAWHTDSTYVPVSSKCAMLSAVTVPDAGGETQLADMRAGYAALEQMVKDRIENMSAYHSTQFSQANDVGDFPPQAEGTIYHGEAFLRPLVKVHPETGIRSLFVGRHAFGIPGLSRQESRDLLKSLTEFVVSDPHRVYTHHWQEGDTLVWDNRALLHRACPYDYSEPRVMTATRVAGDPASELAYYPDDPAAEAGRVALREELALLRTEVSDRRYSGTSAKRRTKTSAKTTSAKTS
jgi:alpha-ketoglutarate-dependent taurine dioxygenase